jgi:hypothetical protein
VSSLGGTFDVVRVPVQHVASIGSQLDELRASSGDYGEAVLDSGLSYVPGRPVCIHVRKRGNRYDFTDAAAAVDLAGRPERWLATASDTVAAMGMNVNRRGVVFVTGFERRDLADLATRLAECSRSVYMSLLDTVG